MLTREAQPVKLMFVLLDGVKQKGRTDKKLIEEDLAERFKEQGIIRD